jgi:hypothetical protein
VKRDLWSLWRWRLAAQQAPVVRVYKRWTSHCEERYQQYILPGAGAHLQVVICCSMFPTLCEQTLPYERHPDMHLFVCTSPQSSRLELSKRFDSPIINFTKTAGLIHKTSQKRLTRSNL